MKYTEERTEKIVNYIKLGLPVVRACHAVNISTETHYRWIKEHDDYEARVREAEAALMARDLGVIEAAAKGGDAKAVMWRLERRFPNDFGKADRLQLQGDSEKPIDLRALISRMNGNSKTD